MSVMGNEAGRDEADANWQERRERGIWGVPSFRIGDTIMWGLDRLYLWGIEQALQQLIS